MNKALISATISSHEDYNADCDYAVLRLSILQLMEILYRRESVYGPGGWWQPKAGRPFREGWLHRAEFLESVGPSWLVHDERLEKDLIELGLSVEELDEEGKWLELPEDFEVPGELVQRVEMEVLLVYSDHFRWAATPKHSHIEVITGSLSVDQVHAWVREYWKQNVKEHGEPVCPKCSTPLRKGARYFEDVLGDWGSPVRIEPPVTECAAAELVFNGMYSSESDGTFVRMHCWADGCDARWTMHGFDMEID